MVDVREMERKAGELYAAAEPVTVRGGGWEVSITNEMVQEVVGVARQQESFEAAPSHSKGPEVEKVKKGPLLRVGGKQSKVATGALRGTRVQEGCRGCGN